VRVFDIEIGEWVLVCDVWEVVLGLCCSKGMVFDVDDYDIWSIGLFFINLIVFVEVVLEGVFIWL